MAEEAKTRMLDEEAAGRGRWARLKEVVHAALPLAGEQRRAFLDEVCAGDEEFRQEVESLLAADSAAEGFLSDSALPLLLEVLADNDSRGGGMGQAATEVNTLPVGMVLDNRYKIMSLLAVGGMSEVYAAEDTNLSRLVVVKVLKKESLKNTWAVKKFRQGAKALTKIEHPGVEQILYVGDLPDGEQYMAVEHVKGVTLRKLLQDYTARGRQVSFSAVAEVIRQAGRGADAVHKAKLIHRDLKPENIMVDEEENAAEVTAKVIDLGIVLDLGTATDSSQSPGTLLYMAPEQLNRNKRITPAADVYALGEIAYEMLTGRHPFQTGDIAHLLELKKCKVRIKPRDLRPDIPEEAERVLLKALSVNASRRQQSAREFGDALAKALASDPQPPARRYKTWAAVAAAAVLVAALGAGLWWFARRPPTRTLTFWLTIVRPHDGKTIQATGRETFDTGDIFKFNAAPGQAGALYLINEGTSGDWNVLFPTPQNNQGLASLAAGQSVETKGYELTNESGAEEGLEKVWVVWATQPIQPLEGIVRRSFDTRLTVGDSSQKEALRRLMAEQAATPPEVSFDRERARVTLKGRGEILVYPLELEHRDWK